MVSPVSQFSYIPGEDGGAFLRVTGAFTLGGNSPTEQRRLDAEQSYFTKGFEVSLGVPIYLQGGITHFMPTLTVRRIWNSPINEITDEIAYTNYTALEILPFSFGGPVTITPEGDVWLALLFGAGIYFFDENSATNLDLGLALIMRLEASLPLGQPHLNLLFGVRGAGGQNDINRYGFNPDWRFDVSGYVGLGGYTPDFNTWGKKATTRTGDEEEPAPPLRKDDPPVVDPKPVPTPTTDPEVQAIIDDIGPWDPEKIEAIMWQTWGLSIINGRYEIAIPFNKEDGMGVIMLNSVESNDDVELNLDAPQYKPLVDFLEREDTSSRIQTLAEQWYTICRKSLGGKLDEDFALRYERDNEGKTASVVKIFPNGLGKAQIKWRPGNDYILSCRVPKMVLYGKLYFVTEPGSDLHTQYIKPFEDELRPYLEQEQAQARQAALATPEPTPEEPTPPVRRAEPTSPPAPAPDPVVPLRITSQKIISQTFDGRNIMSGKIEIVLDGTLEGGTKIVGQNGKDKPDKDISLTVDSNQKIHLSIIFSGVHSTWTYTIFDKATGQEIGKVTVKNPREVKPEVKPEKPEVKDVSPLD